MNAGDASVPPVSTDLQDGTNGNGSDPNSGEEYYRPITGNDSSDTDTDSDELDTVALNHSHGLSNGYIRQVEEGEEEEDSEDADEEEEEEEERMMEASNSSIVREEENRRRAPLTPENATRVMEAMRRIPFPGTAPEWVNHVPENRWIDLLRQRASHQDSSAATSN